MSRAVAFALLFLGCGVAKSTPLQEKFEQTYPLSPAAAITIRNTDGTIYVYGSEVNELKVFARKKAYSKERLDGISIKVSIDGDKASIDTIYPPGPKGLSLQDRSGHGRLRDPRPANLLTSAGRAGQRRDHRRRVARARGERAPNEWYYLGAELLQRRASHGFGRQDCGRIQLVGNGQCFRSWRNSRMARSASLAT